MFDNNDDNEFFDYEEFFGEDEITQLCPECEGMMSYDVDLVQYRCEKCGHEDKYQ